MPRPAVRSMVIIKYTAIAGVTATVTAIIVAAWLTAAISDVVAAAHRDVEWQFGRHAFVERISLSATHTVWVEFRFVDGKEPNYAYWRLHPDHQIDIQK